MNICMLQASVAGCTLSAAPHAAALMPPAAPGAGSPAAAGAAAARTLYAWHLPASPHLAVRVTPLFSMVDMPPLLGADLVFRFASVQHVSSSWRLGYAPTMLNAAECCMACSRHACLVVLLKTSGDA